MNGGADTTAAYRAWAASDLYARGLDAVVIGAAAGVPKSTWLLPGRRERGVALLRGAPAQRLHATRPYRVVPPGEGPAGRALVAVGLAMAGQPSLVFCGTGTTAYGELHAALHVAAQHAAPVVFLVSWYVDAGPFAAPLAVAPVALAAALGLSSVRVDGADEGAVRAAVAQARGPALVQVDLHGRG